MFFRPAAKRMQRFNQGSTQSRERVLHLRRHNGMNSALHHAVALEASQCLGQHFLRNAADLAMLRGITHRSARQNLDNESPPFISNSIQYEPERALRV